MRLTCILFTAALAATATAQEKPEPSFEELFGTGVLQVFDVRDLTERGPSAEKLAAFIREHFAEGLKNVTPSKDRVLVVVASKEVQEKIRAYLTEIRRLLSVVVTIEARFLVLPAKAGNTPRFLDDAETAKLLRFVQMTEGATVTLAPRITCYDGQQAEIRIGSEVSFVSDFSIERAANGHAVLDPLLERLFAGVVVKLRPIVSHGREYVTLIFEVRSSEVATDHDAGKAEHGVKVSEVRESRIRTSVTLQDRHSALLDLGRLPGAKNGQRSLVLVRTEVLVLDEEEARLRQIDGDEIDLVPREGEGDK